MKAVVALVVVMLTWVMLMFAPACSEITKPKPPPPPPPFPTPDTLPAFELGNSNGDDYAGFIAASLRDRLGDPQRLYFGVRMMRKFPPLEYMYLTHRTAEGNFIKLAIRRSDMYVAGYSYGYNYQDQSQRPQQQVRARFFNDPDLAEARKNLFPDAQNPGETNIGSSSNYQSIEGKAQLEKNNDRRILKLGKNTLADHINKVSQTDSKSQPQRFAVTEARLLLIAIQTFPEAARFEYIRKKIQADFDEGYNPDSKAIELEKTWAKLSKAIANAKSKEEVKDIIGDMGLLKYIEPPPKPKWLMMQAVDNVTVWAQ